MEPRQLLTVISPGTNRHFPAPLFAEIAKSFDAHEGLDAVWAWDQLVGFLPSCLWTEANVPAAALGDCDSMHDAVVLAALELAATERLSVHVGGFDAVRHAPAELLQRMYSLASISGADREFICLLAAGEVKQCRPFGWKRAEGLSRLEDLFNLIRLLDKNVTEPTNFEGNHWHYEGAFLGTARPTRTPLFCALGGGPQLISIATRLADGFVTGPLQAFGGVDGYAEQLDDVNTQLVALDRDPGQFVLGAQLPIVATHDPAVIERAIANPIVRAFTAIIGRLNQSDWKKEGLPELLPSNYHYALKFLPHLMTLPEVNEILAGVTDDHVTRSLLLGSPAEVAEQLAAYVNVGANVVYTLDFAGLVLPVEQAMDGLTLQAETLQLLKEKVGSG